MGIHNAVVFVIHMVRWHRLKKEHRLNVKRLRTTKAVLAEIPPERLTVAYKRLQDVKDSKGFWDDSGNWITISK